MLSPSFPLGGLDWVLGAWLKLAEAWPSLGSYRHPGNGTTERSLLFFC